ncbi:MAG: hypothetical protein ACOCQQ_00645 [Candidatus Nanoarchaeia archaeon]
MVTKKTTKKTTTVKTKSASVAKYDKTLTIVGLLLNVLFWPGLGTLINKDTQKGIIQMVLFIVSIPLMFVLIGFPLALGIWIWALVTSINQLNLAE